MVAANRPLFDTARPAGVYAAIAARDFAQPAAHAIDQRGVSQKKVGQDVAGVRAGSAAHVLHVAARVAGGVARRDVLGRVAERDGLALEAGKRRRAEHLALRAENGNRRAARKADLLRQIRLRARARDGHAAADEEALGRFGHVF